MVVVAAVAVMVVDRAFVVAGEVQRQHRRHQHVAVEACSGSCEAVDYCCCPFEVVWVLAAVVVVAVVGHDDAAVADFDSYSDSDWVDVVAGDVIAVAVVAVHDDDDGDVVVVDGKCTDSEAV